MTTVAVTGAGGYVGGRLVAELRGRADMKTIAVVRSPAPWLGEAQRVVDLLADLDDLEAAFEGCDAVVHLAGASEVVFAREPDRAHTETVLATQRVVDAARGRRIVYVSTVHVYGASVVDGATLTEQTVATPRAPYAAARLESERLLTGRADDVVFRLTNSVGPPTHASVDRWTLIGNDLCRQAVTTGELVLKTPGLHWRDFVDLGDVVRILGDACRPGALASGTYNLGSGVPRTVRAFAASVQDQAQRLLGTRPALVAPPPDEPAPPPYRVDVTRLREAGVVAATPIEQSIAATLEFCVAHRAAL